MRQIDGDDGGRKIESNHQLIKINEAELQPMSQLKPYKILLGTITSLVVLRINCSVVKTDKSG